MSINFSKGESGQYAREKEDLHVLISAILRCCLAKEASWRHTRKSSSFHMIKAKLLQPSVCPEVRGLYKPKQLNYGRSVS